MEEDQLIKIRGWPEERDDDKVAGYPIQKGTKVKYSWAGVTAVVLEEEEVLLTDWVDGERRC